MTGEHTGSLSSYSSGPGQASSDLLIGVDGGGTKTVAWIAPASLSSERDVIGRGQSGPGNPRAVGFMPAQESIDDAIGAAFADAGITRRPAAAICLGLAGAGRPEEQAAMRAWAEAIPLAHRVLVSDDAETVLAAGSHEGWGVALVCGTGSVAVGRNADGETARAGGWGYLLADESGAYGIARAGLRAAVRAADGRGPETSLLARFMAHFEIANPADLIGKIYDPAMTEARLAALAAIVFTAAAEDDRARSIVEWALDDLAGLVITLVRRLKLPIDRYPLALAGGVFVHQPSCVLLLLDRLSAHDCTPGESHLVRDPALGALMLAQRALRGMSAL